VASLAMNECSHIPRLIIAGVSSGVGKTTMFTGLCRALMRRGLRVSTFKVGPDYLDPAYHSSVSGTVSHTLDGWLMGQASVMNTFQEVSHGTDIALIEGVMGLFDGGSIGSDEGSTAEIAKWLKAPVLVVVDASGMSRTIAAIALGLSRFDPDMWLAGILCNRVGSQNHLNLLRQASEAIPVVGALPKHASFAFPERHLGLRLPDSASLADTIFERLASTVVEWCDVDRILEIARSAPGLSASFTKNRRGNPGQSEIICRIGVARDEAFHFYYEENLRHLRSAGAELVFFSPLNDPFLPQLDGLYLGGGYPEVYAEALSQNVTLREDLAKFAADGRPIYAECGGLMYLSTNIRTPKGLYPMVGVLEGEVMMHDRLQALGYTEVETTEGSILGPAGLKFRGHQFRYSEFHPKRDSLRPVYQVRRRRDGKVMHEGYTTQNVLASYIHAHWASNPAAAAGFVASCGSSKRV